MPTSWSILLRVLRRHALMALGIVVVVVASLRIDGHACAGADHEAHESPPTGMVSMAAEDDCGGPCDPHGSGQCHCPAIVASAIVSEAAVMLPAPMVCGTAPDGDHDRMPNGWSFVPDPPPDRG